MASLSGTPKQLSICNTRDQNMPQSLLIFEKKFQQASFVFCWKKKQFLHTVKMSAGLREEFPSQNF